MESADSPALSEPLDDSATAQDAPLGSDDLEAMLALRASPRRRVLRAGLVALPVLITLAALLFAFPDALPGSAGREASATATAAAARNSAAVFDIRNTITVVSDVTFGTLTLNGKRVRGRLPQEVTLVRGNNTITLTAPPFAPRTCTIRAPIPVTSISNDPVLEQDSGSGCNFGPSTGGAATSMELAMPMRRGDLPPALQRSALAAVEWTLATAPGYTATLPAGDYYPTGLDANGLPITRRANEPLVAQLSYSLADPATQPRGGFNGCGDLLCPGNTAQLAQISAPVWTVDVIVAQDWHFTTASGEIAGQVAEPQQIASALALSYDSSGWWRVSYAPSTVGTEPGVSSAPSPYGDPCEVAVQMLFSMVEQTQGQEAPSAMPLNVTPGAAQGCRLQVTDQSSPPQATFVYVFGALLAADDGAHKLAPSLPMAPPSEIAAVG